MNIMFMEILKHAILISGFVFTMMLVIEYLNVQTRGEWQSVLKKKKWGQYLLASLLGTIPGCLGAFTVVSLYTHKVVSLGSLVAAMIATSGDEAYLMFSLFPVKALILTIILFFIGIVVGYITDVVYKNQSGIAYKIHNELPIHKEEYCKCFQISMIIPQLKKITITRVLLITMFVFFILSLVLGKIGSDEEIWVKITLLLSAFFGLFVVLTAPDHFLEHHLWEHIIKKHLLRIFLWTFGALLVIHILELYINVEDWIANNYLAILLLAVIIGIIPESGPHMIFVTLFAEGSLPFSILLASSVVQDGHGMLPLLAASRRGFLVTKAINVIVGFVLGLIAWIFHLY